MGRGKGVSRRRAVRRGALAAALVSAATAALGSSPAAASEAVAASVAGGSGSLPPTVISLDRTVTAAFSSVAQLVEERVCAPSTARPGATKDRGGTRRRRTRPAPNVPRAERAPSWPTISPIPHPLSSPRTYTFATPPREPFELCFGGVAGTVVALARPAGSGGGGGGADPPPRRSLGLGEAWRDLPGYVPQTGRRHAWAEDGPERADPSAEAADPEEEPAWGEVLASPPAGALPPAGAFASGSGVFEGVAPWRGGGEGPPAPGTHAARLASVRADGRPGHAAGEPVDPALLRYRPGRGGSAPPGREDATPLDRPEVSSGRGHVEDGALWRRNARDDAVRTALRRPGAVRTCVSFDMGADNTRTTLEVTRSVRGGLEPTAREVPPILVPADARLRDDGSSTKFPMAKWDYDLVSRDAPSYYPHQQTPTGAMAAREIAPTRLELAVPYGPGRAVGLGDRATSVEGDVWGSPKARKDLKAAGDDARDSLAPFAGRVGRWIWQTETGSSGLAAPLDRAVVYPALGHVVRGADCSRVVTLDRRDVAHVVETWGLHSVAPPPSADLTKRLDLRRLTMAIVSGRLGERYRGLAVDRFVAEIDAWPLASDETWGMSESEAKAAEAAAEANDGKRTVRPPHRARWPAADVAEADAARRVRFRDRIGRVWGEAKPNDKGNIQRSQVQFQTRYPLLGGEATRLAMAWRQDATPFASLGAAQRQATRDYDVGSGVLTADATHGGFERADRARLQTVRGRLDGGGDGASAASGVRTTQVLLVPSLIGLPGRAQDTAQGLAWDACSAELRLPRGAEVVAIDARGLEALGPGNVPGALWELDVGVHRHALDFAGSPAIRARLSPCTSLELSADAGRAGFDVVWTPSRLPTWWLVLRDLASGPEGWTVLAVFGLVALVARGVMLGSGGGRAAEAERNAEAARIALERWAGRLGHGGSAAVGAAVGGGGGDGRGRSSTPNLGEQRAGAPPAEGGKRGARRRR